MALPVEPRSASSRQRRPVIARGVIAGNFFSLLPTLGLSTQMSAILDPPATVLFAGFAADALDDVREHVLNGNATGVQVVDEATTARGVASENDVACVVAGTAETDATRPELCAGLSADDLDLPIVVRDDDLELIKAALGGRASNYRSTSRATASTGNLSESGTWHSRNRSKSDWWRAVVGPLNGPRPASRASS